MDSREWINLQEALVWVFAPILNLLLGLFLAGSFFTGVFMMFSRVVRWMTRPERR